MAQKTMLIIDSNPQNNWYQVFKSEKEHIKIEQTAWDLIEVANDVDTCNVTISPSPG